MIHMVLIAIKMGLGYPLDYSKYKSEAVRRLPKEVSLKRKWIY